MVRLKDQVWNNIYIYLALPCLKVIKFFLSSISAVSFVDHIIMYIMYQQFWNMWCGSHVEANFRTPSYLKLKVLTTWHYLRAKSKHLHCFHIFLFLKVIISFQQTLLKRNLRKSFFYILIVNLIGSMDGTIDINANIGIQKTTNRKEKNIKIHPVGNHPRRDNWHNCLGLLLSTGTSGNQHPVHSQSIKLIKCCLR